MWFFFFFFFLTLITSHKFLNGMLPTEMEYFQTFSFLFNNSHALMVWKPKHSKLADNSINKIILRLFFFVNFHIVRFISSFFPDMDQCKVKLATIVEGDPKAPFSIATTPRCRGGRYSIPRNGSMYYLHTLKISCPHTHTHTHTHTYFF